MELQKVDRNARYWIERLRLEAHPEGGYFRQTYKAELVLPKAALPAGFTGARAASTAIYFLLEGKNFSAFHRLRSDELWHFYAGEPLLVQCDRSGRRIFGDSFSARSGGGTGSAGGGAGGMLVCFARGGLEIVCAGGMHGGSGI